MPERKLTVVVSAGQSRNPEKRALEAAVAEITAALDGVQVVQIPHLYDLPAKAESYQLLAEEPGPLMLVSWLYERAAHWVLDRNGVRGQVGEVELRPDEDDEEEDSGEEEIAEDRVTDSQPRLSRNIYCVEFRAATSAEEFRDEAIRILDAESNSAAEQRISNETLKRFETPENDTYIGSTPSPETRLMGAGQDSSLIPIVVDEHPGRRWYPVIDFSRCTNCMECIDFCLFGVYGVDSLETIVVEQADNCRKGCPACSRVCPQNAIIFPQHKTPAIAGAPVDTGGLKIDLSKLFGAPESDEDAVDVAARERDEQLILAGREAVGKDQVIESRLQRRSGGKADELDGLIDELDSLDL